MEVVSCTMMVRKELTPGPPSEVQKACRVHAQRIGKRVVVLVLMVAVGTLFNSVNRVEAVQGMSECGPFDIH